MFWESRSTSEGFAKCISTLTTVVFVSMAFLVSQSTSQKWSKVRNPAEGVGRGVAMPEVSRIPGKRRKKVSYRSLPYFGVFFRNRRCRDFYKVPQLPTLMFKTKGGYLFQINFVNWCCQWLFNDWFNCLQIFVLFWDGGGDYNDKRLSGLNPSGAEL